MNRITFICGFLLLTLVLNAQSDGQEEILGIPIIDEQRNVPINGDNFAFGYEDKFIVSMDYFSDLFLDSDVVSIFLHKGFGDSFGLTVGSFNDGFTNPQLFYIAPEVYFSLTDNAKMTIQLRTVYPDDFSDYAISPTALVSFGTAARNITLGYSPVFDGDTFEAMSFADLNYINASIKISARAPLTNELFFVTKNDISINDGTGLLTRTGIEYGSDNYGVHVLLNHLRFSAAFFGTISDTSLSLGGSYAF